MRGIAGPSRWLWGTSGLVTIMVLAIPGTHLITSAGVPANQYAQPSSFVTRTFTVPQPVTSLDVQSYGAPVQVTAGPVRRVQVTETIQYDPQGNEVASAVPKGNGPPVPKGNGPPVPKGNGPPVPQGNGLPAVTRSVSGGRLTLADPVCSISNCSVGFTVTVPRGVAVTAESGGAPITVTGAAGADLNSDGGLVIATAIDGPLTLTSGGGPVIISRTAGANLDSGSGSVRATGINGPLTVSTEGGPLVLNGLTGTLYANTAGGSVLARNVVSPAATVITGGGPAQIEFTAPPDSALVSTYGGSATLDVPGGPYALTADNGGGPQSVTIATNPAARRTITVTSGGGPLLVWP